MVGARFADELHAGTAATGRVTVLGAEAHRALQPDPALERARRQASTEPTSTLPEAAGARRRRAPGVAVTAIDRGRAGDVAPTTASGIAYDHLVLATGAARVRAAAAGLLGADGTCPAGGRASHPRRLPRDPRRRRRRAAGASCSAAALLGLEAARGLAGRGLAVTVVHGVGHLMERQLDPAAERGAGPRRSPTSASGTDLGARAVAVRADGDGVAASPGRRTATARPTCSWWPAASARDRAGRGRPGCAVERGIVVDDRLRTSDPRVFAIGDCAEHRRAVTGLVAPAWEQARGGRRRARPAPTAAATRPLPAGRPGSRRPASTWPRWASRRPATPTARRSLRRPGPRHVRQARRPRRPAGRGDLLGDNPSRRGHPALRPRRAGARATAARCCWAGRSAARRGAGARHAGADARRGHRVPVQQVTKGALVRVLARRRPRVRRTSSRPPGPPPAAAAARDAVDGIVDWLSTADPCGGDAEHERRGSSSSAAAWSASVWSRRCATATPTGGWQVTVLAEEPRPAYDRVAPVGLLRRPRPPRTSPCGAPDDGVDRAPAASAVAGDRPGRADGHARDAGDVRVRRARARHRLVPVRAAGRRAATCPACFVYRTIDDLAAAHRGRRRGRSGRSGVRSSAAACSAWRPPDALRLLGLETTSSSSRRG